MAGRLYFPKLNVHSERPVSIVTPVSEKLNEPKIVPNENLEKITKPDLGRKNKVQEVFNSKSSHASITNSVEEIDEQEMESANDEDELKEIPKRNFPKNGIPIKKAKEFCQVCEAQIQTDFDYDDDDDDRTNRWFVKFFKGLILAGFIMFLIVIIHSEFFLSKTVEKIISDKEVLATDGIIEKVSGPIMYIVNLGGYCLEQIINRL